MVHRLDIQRRNYAYRILLIIIPIICVITAVSVYYHIRNYASQNDDLDDLNDATPATIKWIQNKEIQLFRRYLRFKTISIESDFEPCVNFLKKQANELDFTVSINYPVNEKNPVIVMTWKGSKPDLPSIMLNSHMDVVPAAEDYWDYPPFAAKIDNYGNIYARGAQDMKSVGMQYLAAARALKHKGIAQLKRTIHITYMPDEEVGGFLGMLPFVESDAFKKLNVGFTLDEGYPSTTDHLEVFNREKVRWVIKVIANGHSGHASNLFDDTAAMKLNYVINKFLELRNNETKKWKEDKYPYGNVTSINLTILNGGLGSNVVPPDMTAIFDIRLAIDTDFDKFEQMIKSWEKEAGNNITINIRKQSKTMDTQIDDSNLYWIAFKKATDELRLNVTPGVFPAATDSKYIRQAHIPALGFSPLLNTLPKLHEHNEYINVETYLKGIDIYTKIIEEIANF